MKDSKRSFPRISNLIQIGLILAALILIIVIPGFAAGTSVAEPAQAPTAPEKTGDACALLDDPAAREKMSGMFETKLLNACGRTDELGRVAAPAAPAPFAPLLGPDVQVNDSTGEIRGHRHPE